MDKKDPSATWAGQESRRGEIRQHSSDLGTLLQSSVDLAEHNPKTPQQSQQMSTGVAAVQDIY
jgi:hypothetical protein